MPDSPRESHDLATELFGPSLARFISGAVLAGKAALGLLAVATVFVSAHTYLRPAIARLPLVPVGTAWPMVLSATTAALLVGGASYALVLHIRRREDRYTEMLDGYLVSRLGALHTRVDYVESNAADHKSTVESIEYLNHRVAEIDQRLGRSPQ